MHRFGRVRAVDEEAAARRRRDQIRLAEIRERAASKRRTKLGLPPLEVDAHFSDDPKHKNHIAPNAYKGGRYNPNWASELVAQEVKRQASRASKAKPRGG